MKTMKMINKFYEYIENKEFNFWSDIADNYTDEEATNKIYKRLKFQTIQLILYLPLISLLHYIAITQLELATILIPIISVVDIIYVTWVISIFDMFKYYIELSIITGRYKAIKELAQEELNKHD